MGCKDILLPKPQDEILEALHKLSPDEMISICIEAGYLPGVKAAIKNGANVNFRKSKASSYLVSAMILRHEEIVYCLLEAGAEACYDALLSAMKNPPVFGLMLQNINPKLMKNSKFKTMYEFAKLKGLREIRNLIEERIKQNIN